MVKSRRSWLVPLAIILVTSIALRVAVALFLGDSIEELRGGTYDQISYDALAVRVADGFGFNFDRDWWPATRAGEPTAHWSFLYVLSLAGVYNLFGHHPLAARLLQAVIVGILTPWLVYRIGSRTFNRNAGILAGAIAAIYAYFLMYGAALMTEALYIVSILWSIDVAMRLAKMMTTDGSNASTRRTRRRLLLGAELGLAIAAMLLLRQVIMAFIIVLIVWLLWVAKRRATIRAPFISLMTAAFVVTVILAPIVVRNYRAFGRLTALNTNAGFALFWSNHPIYGTRFESVLSPSHGTTYQELIPPELLYLDEASLDRELLGRGIEFILTEPGRYLLLSLSRIPVYFLFWPKTDSTLLSNLARLLSFALFLPAMIYGLFLSLKNLGPQKQRQDELTETTDPVVGSVLRYEFVILLLGFLFIYTGVHLASWANVRYRLPVDAVLIIFAGYGIENVYFRLKTRRALAGAMQ